MTGRNDLQGSLVGPWVPGQHRFAVAAFHSVVRGKCRDTRPMHWRSGHWRSRCLDCGQEYCEGQLMEPCPGARAARRTGEP